MILLKKKKINNSYFDFDKILQDGYTIDEQPNLIDKRQLANGKRKKIITSYTDVVITVNLGLCDNETLQEYLSNLVDGEYKYYSYKDNCYKSANFIITMPPIVTNYAYDGMFEQGNYYDTVLPVGNDTRNNKQIGIDDFEIVLEKSSDVT